jgi:phage tail-like protein
MARSSILDPLDKFRWTVQVDGFAKLGFSFCSSPEEKKTTTKYPEGGAHLTPRIIVDGVEYTPVTLKRGVTTDASFDKWASGHEDLVTNNWALNESSSAFGIPVPAAVAALGLGGPTLIKSANSYPFNYRRTLKIEHTNRIGVVEKTYTLYNAFPIEYKPASDFDAMADDEISIETLVIAYEGFDVRYASLAAVALNILGNNQ